MGYACEKIIFNRLSQRKYINTSLSTCLSLESLKHRKELEHTWITVHVAYNAGYFKTYMAMLIRLLDRTFICMLCPYTVPRYVNRIELRYGPG